MKGYLLDTNIISEYSRSAPPSPEVTRWVDAQDEDRLYLSVLTVGEIRQGTTLLPHGRKRNQLEQWLELEMIARFADRLLPISREVAEIWGAMAGEAQLKGVSLAIIDGLVAATAKHHELAVVTRNVRDFSMWKIPTVNPWEQM